MNAVTFFALGQPCHPVHLRLLLQKNYRQRCFDSYHSRPQSQFDPSDKMRRREASSQPPSYQRNVSIATSAPSQLETKWMHHTHWDGGNNNGHQKNGNAYHRYSNSFTRTSSSSGFPAWKIVPCMMLLILPWIPCKYKSWQLNSQKSEYLFFKKEQTKMIQEIRNETDQIRVLRHESEKMTKHNEEHFQELRANGGSKLNLEDEQYLQLEYVEEGYIQRIDKLQQQIQDACQSQVVDRFGSGPHKVEATVRDDIGRKSKFVIQMALLDEMPHAVNHFLRMVELKLWDGLSLVHGADSDIISATPLEVDTHQWAGQRFEDANLTRMAFTEYSTTYPPPLQNKYSVSFAGRPGGPSFYISLEDEIEFHEHESTFGMVVDGKDVLDRFYAKNPSANKKLKIESLRLIKD